MLNLLGLGGLTSVGGLFVDVSDGARVDVLDALPELATVSGAGVQLLGARQVGAAPGLAKLQKVEGQLFLLSTALTSLESLQHLRHPREGALRAGRGGGVMGAGRGRGAHGLGGWPTLPPPPPTPCRTSPGTPATHPFPPPARCRTLRSCCPTTT